MERFITEPTTKAYRVTIVTSEGTRTFSYKHESEAYRKARECRGYGYPSVIWHVTASPLATKRLTV
jgi:hypothetical protein